MPTKNNFFLLQSLLLLLFEGTITSFFKDKKSIRGQKIIEIKAFLTFFAC
jgi:hypothetical protein